VEASVVVCNVFPDDNKGGCAITVQTIAWLKRTFPARPVVIVPVEPSGRYERDRFRFTLERHPDVRILRSPIRTDGTVRTTLTMLVRSLAMLLRARRRGGEFERTIAGAAVVVSKGGYVFVERDTLRSLLALWFTAFPLIYAGRANVPTIALCTTVGPFRRILSRRLSRWILGRVDAVVTRDPISTAEARALGRADVVECPDIVLTFDRERIAPGPSGNDGRPMGTYGVLVLSGETKAQDEVFLARMSELSKRILNDGLVDRLMVPLQSLEDKGITTRFLACLDDPRCAFLHGDLSPEELMGLYRDARFLIGRRLHGGLFAMLSGTPAILFATDGVKANGVMGALGYAGRVAPYPAFSVDEVYRLLVDILDRGPDERREISARIEEAAEDASETLRALGRRFQPRAEPRAETKEWVG
jgi:polysaccharide pyruvyl transferase WcaK-like protein